MGVVGTVLGTLGMAFLQGRAQQQQYEAQARQAEANAAIQQQNAEIMARNSEKARQNAEEAARVNAMNVENERRKRSMIIGKQEAAGGASGLTNSGSLANALKDSQQAINYDTMIDLLNGGKTTQQYFNQSTDFTNQQSQYQFNADSLRKEAGDLRAAGQRAKINALLTGGLQAGMGLLSTGSSANSLSGSGQTWTVMGKAPSVAYNTQYFKLRPTL